MSRAFQPYAHPLRSPTYSVGGQDAISFEGMPTRIFGRIAHMIGLMIQYSVTGTASTAPTVVGQHSVIRSLVFYDGVNERANLSLFDLRSFEILENGVLQLPDSPIIASASPTVVTRYLPLGPQGFEGNPTDFAMPVAALKSGELRLNFGALTDWSADCSALTMNSFTISAILVPIDNELRLPPAFERRSFNYGTTEAMIQGKALYTTVAITKQDNTVFTTGQLGTVSWDSGSGQAPTLTTGQLTAIAQYFTLSTHVGQLTGDPVNAGQTGLRSVNATTPTALETAPGYMQSVVTSPEDSRITKLIVESTAALRIRWSGSFATPKVLVGRILEQPLTAYGTIGSRASQALGLQVVTSRVKTLDKTAYRGPRELYMPMAAKVAA